MSEWFDSWFNSPYYSMLYRHRDEHEAAQFIESLVHHIQPTQGATCLDLACGNGRHSRQLHNLGLSVTGVDYSTRCIDFARAFEQEGLRFFEHDMREALPDTYDHIFNLFTSFGYFDTLEEHQRTLEHISNGLKKGGYFAIDFLNVHHVVANLIPSEKIQINGTLFRIERRFDGQNIIKDITIEDKGNKKHFQECVMAFDHKQLRSLIEQSGLTITETFGDYNLAPFHRERSNRLIILARK